MDMQGKEFDQLFRSKLEELEIEPSKSVWQGVNDSLGNNRRKKMIPFLSIAASFIVLIAAGILFIPKKENSVKLHAEHRVAAVKPSKVVLPLITKQPVTIAPFTAIVPAKNPLNLYRKGNSYRQITAAKQPVTNRYEPLVPALNDQQVLAATSVKTESKQGSAIDSPMTLATAKPLLQNTVTIAAVPDMQTTSLPPAQKIADVMPIKKRSIHGLGDVLNVVVAAVDKRKDKIIEFADSDGDGATVTAVNLGPIKVKKEN